MPTAYTQYNRPKTKGQTFKTTKTKYKYDLDPQTGEETLIPNGEEDFVQKIQDWDTAVDISEHIEIIDGKVTPKQKTKAPYIDTSILPTTLGEADATFKRASQINEKLNNEIQQAQKNKKASASASNKDGAEGEVKATEGANTSEAS